eukprot:7994464-Lingulodinium_polyedra.AAC.1
MYHPIVQGVAPLPQRIERRQWPRESVSESLRPVSRKVARASVPLKRPRAPGSVRRALRVARPRSRTELRKQSSASTELLPGMRELQQELRRLPQ